VTPVVQMRRVSIGYGERPAVRDVDFSLSAGEVVVLLGPNGAGKSTLVRGILGLARVMAGDLELFGVPAAELRERHRIGYVPQRHTVTGGVPSTVREVVSSGRLPLKPLLSWLTAADRAAVDAAIDVVGLTERAEAPIATLSGGQQRRALIARALAAEPDVLVMDEPTAGVDAANQEILAATLRTLVDRGSTLLVVAHELGPLAPLIDRVVRVRDGRIEYDGPPTPADTAPYDGHHHHDEPERDRTPGLDLGGQLP
jgi:zinc transport system ATP-binding protein